MGFGRMKKRKEFQKKKRDFGFSMHGKMRRVLIGHIVFFLKRKEEGFSWEGRIFLERRFSKGGRF